MAQDFEKSYKSQVTTSAYTLITSNSDDAIVGINLANVTVGQIKISVYVTNSGSDFYIIKDVPIPSGAALQVLDGGAKFVLQSGDALKIQSDTASSCDAWVSRVDTISS